VAHTCNPSYSGGRDQEDSGSKPAQTNSSMRSYLKKTLHKKGLVDWLNVSALSSSPSTAKKKKKNPNSKIFHNKRYFYINEKFLKALNKI
jgi:hypothetical protein